MKQSFTPVLGTRRRELIGAGAVLAAAFAGLFLLAEYSFLLSHAIAEMFSVAVAFTIFFLAWNARHYFDNGYFVLLGIAYLCVGTVDLVHTVAYKGMGFFGEHDSNLPTQLWILARYIESLSLAGALLFVNRKIRLWPVFSSLFLVTAAGLVAVFLDVFPDCYLPDSGLTPFKKVSEYVIAAILAGTLFGVYRLRRFFHPHVLPYIYVSIFLTVLAEMTFTSYMSVYGFSNMLGHYFKVVSFYLIYRGVVVTGVRDPYALLMQQLQERNRELEESRDFIRRTQKIDATMLDNIPEEIALLDADTLEIIDVNRTFLQNYGIEREETLGRTCHYITHRSEAPCSGEDHLCPLFSPGSESEPIVHCHRGSEGEIHYVEITVVPVEGDRKHPDEPRQLVHISRDITERKRTEQLREDIERVIRHDLKSPLNGIIGGAQLIMQDDSVNEEQQQLLKGIYDSGMSVLEMVNHSLDMYKMAEGTYELHAEVFDLAEVLKRLAARWQSQRTAKELSLEFYVEERPIEKTESCFVYGEERSVERLLANLIENAIEASPHGGTVTVTAAKKGDRVRFEIHNLGVIPEEVRNHFFERYVTHGKQRGTGLGTYSAWLIARAHGGRISYTTGEEEGTRLIVELPY
jgi:PAS domain S-box-containing protein